MRNIPGKSLGVVMAGLRRLIVVASWLIVSPWVLRRCAKPGKLIFGVGYPRGKAWRSIGAL